MATTVFYHPDGQVEAIYRGCRPGPGVRDGLLEAVAPDGMRVNRDMKVAVADGMVTGVEPSVNPIQPILPKPEPTSEAVILEAAKAAGITLDLDAARDRLKSAKPTTSEAPASVSPAGLARPTT